MLKKISAFILLLTVLGCNSSGNNASKVPSKLSKGDGYIARTSIEHKPTSQQIFLSAKNEIRIFLKAGENDIEKLTVVFNDGKEQKVKMESLGTSTEKYELYTAIIKTSSPKITYYFECQDLKNFFYYGSKSGLTAQDVTPFEYTVEKESVQTTPDWAKKAVWYSLIIDRYRNGDKSNDALFNTLGPESFSKPIIPTTQQAVSVSEKSKTIAKTTIEAISTTTETAIFTTVSSIITSDTAISTFSSITTPAAIEDPKPAKPLIPEVIDEKRASLIPLDSWTRNDSKSVYGSFTPSSFSSDFEKMEPWEKKLKENNSWYKSFFKHYGGDIAGLTNSLDYLKKLGVSAVIISPPFFSYSATKYDSADWRHIDPSFGVIEQTGETYGFTTTSSIVSSKGTLEYPLLSNNDLGENELPITWKWTQSDLLFFTFIKEAHKKGLKVLIDIDFSYTSNRFWAFEQALINGPTSQYAKWFYFTNWKKTTEYSDRTIDTWNPGIPYAGTATAGTFSKADSTFRRAWVSTPRNATPAEKFEIMTWNKFNVAFDSYQNITSLPKLNLSELNVQFHITETCKRWVNGPSNNPEDGVDGYIISSTDSVANQNYWVNLKTNLRTINPNIFIAADISSNEQTALSSGRFDSFLNYNFGALFNRFIGATESREKLLPSTVAFNSNKYFKSFQTDSEKVIMNILDTKDTDRVFSMLINPNREFDTANKLQEGATYKNISPALFDPDSLSNLKLLTLIQMTYSGTPLIYYGDEVGMWGADDPYNRKPMLWEDITYDKETDTLDKYISLKEKLSKDIDIDEANNLIKYPVSVNKEVKDWYQKLLDLRNKESNLFTNGALKYLVTDNTTNVLAFERTTDKKAAIILINNSDKEVTTTITPTKQGVYTDQLGTDRYPVLEDKISVKLPKKSCALLLN